jgi:hypothetical protein
MSEGWIMKRTKLVDRSVFQAEDGEHFEVLTYQDVIDAGTYDNPHATIDGLKWLELPSGEKLNYVDEDTVRFVHRGQATLTRAK